MKKIFLIAICILITGCQKEKNIYTIKANIEENILKHKDYNNLSSCKIDEINNTISIELINNSEEEQEWFKNNISNSNKLIFKQGKEIKQEELTYVYNYINDYINSNGQIENYTGHYIDEIWNSVVVSLLENNQKHQNNFKQNIIDSNLIEFKKGNYGIDQ